MTKREKEILEIIKNNPMITQNEIAEKLNITRSSVGVHITNLINKGHIKGRGYIISDDKYVVVIGGANVDIVGRSYNKLIDEDSNPGEINISNGGVGRNIAENITRLGIDTRLITAIGNDSNGEIIKDKANQLGINLSNSLFLENERTATYMAILHDNNDLNIAISDMSIMDKINPEIIYNRRKIIENAKLTVLDTNLREDTLEYILKNINQDFFVDTVSTTKAKKILNLLPYIHTLKPNKYEAELLSGIKINNETDIIDSGKILIKKGLKRVFLTLGEEGLYYFDKENIIKVKSKKLQAENTIGAGDAFISGLVYSKYNNLSIEETIYISVGASRVAIKDIDTISKKLNIENIKKEKKEIEIC